MTESKLSQTQLFQESIESLAQKLTRADLNGNDPVIQTLLSENTFLKLVVEHIPVGVFVKDVKAGYRFIIWNAKMEEIFGISAKDAINHTDYDFNRPKPENDYYHYIDEAVMRDGKTIDIPAEPITTPRGKGLAHTIKVPVFDMDGEPEFLVGILEDITNKLRTEQALVESEILYHTIFNQGYDGIFLENYREEIVDVNDTACRMFGYSRDEFLKMKIADIQTTEARNLPKSVIYQPLSALNRENFESTGVRSDGEVIPLEIMIARFELSGQQLFLTVMRDISERKRADAAEHAARDEAEKRALETQDALQREQHLNEVVRIISGNLDIKEILQKVVDLTVSLLKADAGMLGIISDDKKELEFRNHVGLPVILLPLMPLPRGEGVIWEVIEHHKGILVSEYKAHPLAKGALVDIGINEVICVPIMSGEECLGALSIYRIKPNRHFTVRDLALAETIGLQAGVTIKNASLFENVQRLATTDSLTKLTNRRYFFELAKREVERTRRNGGTISCIMLDLDHFKRVNDTYGHPAGDQVLIAVAECCSNNIRAYDLLCRYGGEEFVVLLPEAGLKMARATAERLREEISRLNVIYEGEAITITTSLGLSCQDKGEEMTLETLLGRADQALYAAKTAGRNRVAVWKTGADWLSAD